jgi:hypothetical protein
LCFHFADAFQCLDFQWPIIGSFGSEESLQPQEQSARTLSRKGKVTLTKSAFRMADFRFFEKGNFDAKPCGILEALPPNATMQSNIERSTTPSGGGAGTPEYSEQSWVTLSGRLYSESLTVKSTCKHHTK